MNAEAANPAAEAALGAKGRSAFQWFVSSAGVMLAVTGLATVWTGIIHSCKHWKPLFTCCCLAATVVAETVGVAMTPDEFATFLNRPPTCGHARVLKITPVTEENVGRRSATHGITNRLIQACEYWWQYGDVLAVLIEGETRTESGLFHGMEWEHLADNLTKYAGTNRDDRYRRRSSPTAGYVNLMSLGIWFFVQGSARLDNGVLDGEIDMPEIRAKIGHNPRMRGRFERLPNGSVRRLEYAVRANEQDFLFYAVDYDYRGKWGVTFPSWFCVSQLRRRASETNAEPILVFYENEIHEWSTPNTLSPRETQLFNPDVMFSNSMVHILSNDILYDIHHSKLIPITIKGPPSQRARSFVIVVLAALAVGFGWVAWRLLTFA
jgi:hypothetical protein